MSSHSSACPSCRSEELSFMVEVRQMPVHVGSLWPTAQEARECPKGDIVLHHCRSCQLVFNAAFDPEPLAYTQDYDNSLESSEVFMRYATELANRLIERYGLRDKTVVEIGCGKGAFIGLLCQLGPNRGIGYDTTHDPGSPNPAPGALEFVRAHYTAEQTSHGADLVACRHVLEHIPDPMSFLGMLRESLGDRTDTVVYFEVPEVLFIVRDLSIWDLMYEHCTYFGHESLANAFERAGFEVLNLRDDFDDQFLGIEVRPTAVPSPTRHEVPQELRVGHRVAEFTRHFEARRKEWGERLRALTEAGKRVTIWAAGGKTVSFMNLFQVSDQIDSIVDINPRKQGMHLPGTGHEILHPDALRERRPDTVIVMNAHYKNEIATQLESMGLAPEILTA